jgi:hypothetical protein
MPRVGADTTYSDWSGYVETSSTSDTYTSISGTWRVPPLTHSNGGISTAAQWIGIDGWALNPLAIEAGTQVEEYYGSKTLYTAWWSLAPKIETVIHKPVAPGETIHASIVKTGSSWVIRISNGSWTFTTTQTYGGPAESAEAIVSPGVASPPPSFLHTGGVTFENLKVNGTSPRYTPADALQLDQSIGRSYETPSLPSTAGNAFVDAYGLTTPKAP